MEDGYNLGKVKPETIDDTIVAVGDLAKRLVPDLWHHSPRERIVLKSCYCGYELFNE